MAFVAQGQVNGGRQLAVFFRMGGVEVIEVD